MLDHSLPLHSGYAFRTAALLREERARGWQVTQLTTPRHAHQGPARETIDGFTYYRTALPREAGRTGSALGEARLVLSVARRIREVARAEKPHLLHAHSPVLNALSCLLAACTLRLPVVYEVRAFWEDAAVTSGKTREGSLRYRATQGLETFALKASDAVTTICDGLRLDMERRGVPAEKITLIPNGVDPAAFPFLDRAHRSEECRALRRALGLEEGLVLAFFGSFYPYEGLDLLIDALPAIRKAEPAARLVLAGGGPAEGALKARVRACGLESAVRFLGRIAQAELVRYYALADLFVFPRRRTRLTETVTPLKPLEAMATGGVVLASDVGGHRELIRDGETGVLFPAGEAGAVSAAVIEALAARAAWTEMGAHARRFIERERTWTQCAAGYASAYARALHGARRAGGAALEGRPS